MTLVRYMSYPNPPGGEGVITPEDEKRLSHNRTARERRFLKSRGWVLCNEKGWHTRSLVGPHASKCLTRVEAVDLERKKK